ncbi:hypothetical protein [Streptomyces cellulosae]|uniref:hypothetical protein n=1 Tax=Streptomyces cellulosae TaxID=1968 RepID=UPI00068F737B|nr:hypothetical protein [Streptomyces cellulosae]
MSPDRPQSAYVASAAGLAVRALDALRGVGGTALVARHVEEADDPTAALAAVRVVGADIFAPCLLADAAFHPEDAAVITQSFTVFPPASVSAPPPTGAAEPWIAAWRDWATATLLASRTGTEPDGILAPRPPASAADLPVDTADPGSQDPDTAISWQRWSVRMGQLSPLALPGLKGPVHTAARAAPLALARGATRAVLRRDFPTAMRITRWLALLSAEGVRLPLDPVPMVEHLRLHGGGPRLALDAAIARQVLGLEAP